MPTLDRVRLLITGRLGFWPARVVELVFIALAGWAIFVLPYWVPPQAVVFSISYDFGFNNRIAVLAALASVLLAPFFLGKDGSWPKMAPAAEPNAIPARYPFWLMVALHGIVIGFYFLVTLAGAGTPDGSYFLSNAISMSQGLRPYVDFEFAYGPALLYPTHWLTLTGLPAHAAYFIFYFFLTLAGLFVARRFADLLPVRPETKSSIFLLVCGVSIVSLPTVGVNYAIMRFVTPLWILAELSSAHVRSLPVLKQALMACGGVLFVDLISPEIGSALSVSASAFYLFIWFKEGRQRSWGLVAAAACPALHAVFVVLLMPPEFRASMLMFSRGFINLPVVPSAICILYLACLAVGFMRHVPPRDGRSPVFAALAIFSLGLLPGAFTHADAGHIAWDGLAAYTLAIVGDGSKRGLPRHLLAFAPALLFAAGTPFFPTRADLRQAEMGAVSLVSVQALDQAVVDVGQALHVNPSGILQRIENRSEAASARRRWLDREVAAATAFPSSGLLFSTDYQLQERLARKNLRSTYYFSLTNVGDRASVERAVNSLRDADLAVLVLTEVRFSCPTEADEQKVFSRALDYPFHVRRKHDSCLIYKPYYDYILQNYQRISPDKPIWVKRGADRVNTSATDPVGSSQGSGQ